MNHRLKLNYRFASLFLGLFATFLFLASLYFQYVEQLEPCPLCISQRVAVFVLAISYLSGFLIKKTFWMRFNIIFQFIFGIFGASMAGRQVWLMHIPASERTGCMPDISLLWHYLPFREIVRAFFSGTESCTENIWSWLGITMPEWTLGFFVFFILASIFLCFRYLRCRGE